MTFTGAEKFEGWVGSWLTREICKGEHALGAPFNFWASSERSVCPGACASQMNLVMDHDAKF